MKTVNTTSLPVRTVSASLPSLPVVSASMPLASSQRAFAESRAMGPAPSSSADLAVPPFAVADGGSNTLLYVGGAVVVLGILWAVTR
jgi:hypothetical protein